MHRGLMTDRRRLDDVEIERACRAAGVDWPRLVSDRADHAVAIETQLRRHALQAWSLGLQGTPGYLVGPFLIAGGLDSHALERAVGRARRTGPPRTAV